jgi:uncharacterized GH25 family protein
MRKSLLSGLQKKSANLEKVFTENLDPFERQRIEKAKKTSSSANVYCRTLLNDSKSDYNIRSRNFSKNEYKCKK